MDEQNKNEFKNEETVNSNVEKEPAEQAEKPSPQKATDNAAQSAVVTPPKSSVAKLAIIFGSIGAVVVAAVLFVEAAVIAGGAMLSGLELGNVVRTVVIVLIILTG